MVGLSAFAWGIQCVLIKLEVGYAKCEIHPSVLDQQSLYMFFPFPLSSFFNTFHFQMLKKERKKKSCIFLEINVIVNKVKILFKMMRWHFKLVSL